MATIKSYTDLSQSKKLAEILPLESADMHYFNYGNIAKPYIDFDVNKTRPEINNKVYEYIPCWSFTALLSVLNFPSLTQNKEDEWEVCVFDHDNDNYIERTASNPVDACMAMVEKLHELKML